MDEEELLEHAAKALIDLTRAFPRFKETCMQQQPVLMLKGNLKLIHTLQKVTTASNAQNAKDRFKLLLPKCEFLSIEQIQRETQNAANADELLQQVRTFDQTKQYLVVILGELQHRLVCIHGTGGGYPAAVPDTGPWLYVMDRGESRANKRPGFSYTGTLRPYRVSPRRQLPEGTVLPDYASHGQPYAENAADARHRPPVLNSAQVEKMRRVCLLGREIMDAAHAVIRPGVTTDEIDRVVHEKHVEVGAYPAPLNYYNFPKSCCTSVNEVVCHGIPDMRELEDGDIVNVDISPILDGLHADLNETFCVGNVAQNKKDLIKASHDSLMKAIAVCKPGYFYRDLGNVITKHVHSCGFAVDKTYCGHGVGEYFHCSPNIPHYAGNKAKFTMQVGHCFTIEPMINMGSWKDTHWPDGWTAVTKDGKPSAQFEHCLLVNKTGVEILTARLPSSPPLWWEI